MVEEKNLVGKVLIIDDEELLPQVLRQVFVRKGHQVQIAGNGARGLELLEQQEFDVVITDLKMPGEIDGLGVLKEVRERYPNTQVIMMTAYATTETAIQALKMGAYDYVQKPHNNEEMLALVSKCLEKRALLKENVQLRSELQTRYSFGNLYGKSKVMRQIFALLDKVADSDVVVLITGQNGTGKELVARAIHYNSKRSDGPFIPVNCGAFSEALIESELFGHEKGAFTGADKQKSGLFRAAEGGTLFLDEIGELPLSLQPKLLRVLEEREVRPVGDPIPIPVDVRIISATNRDLQKEMLAGRFREDLYHRLKVMAIEMPPLSERKEDIPLLAERFLEQFSNDAGRTIEGFSKAAMKLLIGYKYHGNIRELKNIIERAVLLESASTIQPESLPPEVRGQPDVPPAQDSDLALPEEGIDAFLAQMERKLLVMALRQTKGKKKEAARLLKLEYRKFRYRVNDVFGIRDEEFE